MIIPPLSFLRGGIKKLHTYYNILLEYYNILVYYSSKDKKI